jgi:2-oxoglutarate dehydrogenase E1 component
MGYSPENPNPLVLWETQFGAFGAQVIFYQVLRSGKSKWLRQSGLVVLLPHGYDRPFLEHSSARTQFRSTS